MQTNHVAIWIDHKEAHILYFDASKNESLRVTPQSSTCITRLMPLVAEIFQSTMNSFIKLFPP
jgi:hypothetical protein